MNIDLCFLNGWIPPWKQSSRIQNSLKSLKEAENIFPYRLTIEDSGWTELFRSNSVCRYLQSLGQKDSSADMDANVHFASQKVFAKGEQAGVDGDLCCGTFVTKTTQNSLLLLLLLCSVDSAFQTDLCSVQTVLRMAEGMNSAVLSHSGCTT